jgi:hypothetical protein
MTTANLDNADLVAVARGGWVREDVMNRIWDISKIPLPFTDSLGSDTTINSNPTWLTDSLGAPDPTNAVIDGSDAGADQSTTGKRVGNHCQTSTKVFRVSQRAQNVEQIGTENSLAYQLMKGQQRLRRDVEAILLLNQASFADTGAAAGNLGGFAAWLTTNATGGAGWAAGGYDTATGLVDAFTAGAQRGLTETLVRNAAQAAWQAGGDPSVLMSVPGVIRGLSEYMFTSSARIATLQRESGGDKATALGTVNVFITDFDVTLTMRANRMQQTYASIGGTVAQVASVLIYDPSYVMQTFLQGYETAPLAKTGLADNRQISVDYTLKVMAEDAHAAINDINPLTPVVL